LNDQLRVIMQNTDARSQRYHNEIYGVICKYLTKHVRFRFPGQETDEVVSVVHPDVSVSDLSPAAKPTHQDT